ncbi:MAG: glycosyltransferase [Paraprevotella sp.]|nr:glycosyltransferase [Paraprevotella sp.]
MESTDLRLSVLIPTYNFDCTPLAEVLSRQAGRTDIPVEILIADDGSTREDIRRSIGLCDGLPHVRLVRPACNIGRSAIRNLLFRESAGTHLLFLDSDGVPSDGAFLSRYIEALREHPHGVVCGGILHPDRLPSPAVSLRWRYEKAAERRFTQAWKASHPYDCFRSFNFLIDRESFARILFDESIRHYGFEDVLFGRRLQECGIPVYHTENPLTNTDIEPNETYLRKNEEALRTLADHYGKLHQSVRIAQAWEKLRRLRLLLPFRFCFRLLRPCLRRHLCGSRPSVFLLNVYKLGYLDSCINKG